MIVLKDSPAFSNQPIAHIFGEIPDVSLLGCQAEFVAHPAIGILSCQDAALPDRIEGSMGPDPQVAQISVCKSALWNLGSFVDTDVCIASWIMLAHIQLIAVRIFTVDIGSVAQDSGTSAVRTFDCFFLRFHNFTP